MSIITIRDVSRLEAMMDHVECTACTAPTDVGRQKFTPTRPRPDHGGRYAPPTWRHMMAEQAHTDAPKRPPDSLLSDFQPTPKGLGRGRQKKRPEAATCGGCGKRWIGDKIAHCPRCHETFTDAAAFDTHVGGDYRSGLACLKPKSVGLSSRDGIWSTKT